MYSALVIDRCSSHYSTVWHHAVWNCALVQNHAFIQCCVVSSNARPSSSAMPSFSDADLVL